MTHKVTIRRARPDDADALAAFNIAMAQETEHKHLDPATVARGGRAVLANADYGFYVVAVVAGEIVGSLLVTYEWSDWRCGLFWWVQSVYVRPESRRHGIFRQLYASVQGEASRTPDVCGLRLYVEDANHAAHQVYATIGMQRTPYHLYEQLL